MAYKGLIEKYKKYLQVSEKTPIITLHEGNTPLIPARNLTKKIGFSGEIYFKYEGLNPTGSFKDRGMTMAVSKAVEEGSKAVICASTGNTSASAAAYASRAGIKCVVLIPEGKIALGKLSQAVMHGATVLEIDGNFDKALDLVKDLSKNYPLTLVNSINPYRIEGQKTGAFEICECLETTPDYQFIPEKYKLPKIMGFQAEGAAPIVKGHKIDNPETLATAIRIGNPASWKTAEQARDESKGVIDMVCDDEIIEAYKMIARYEGIFAEPASASSFAGLLKYTKKGYFKDQKDIKAVCILTGHGLKDPDNAIKSAIKPTQVKANMKDIIKAISF